jgi:thiol-disulfide isomerase/thioredoxin
MRCATVSVLGLALVVAASAPGVAAELDQHGRQHAWQGSVGRYTVIDFAASWCAPCRTSLPRVAELAGRFPELGVLVVSVDERVEGRDALIRDLGLELPVIWDRDDRIAELYRPAGMPATVLLDPNGAVVHRHVGSGIKDWRRLVEIVESLMATPSSP